MRTRSRARMRDRRASRLGLGIVLLLAFGLLVAPATTVQAQAENGRPIRFGVFPFLPPLSLDQVFRPVVADLAEAVGRPIMLRTKGTFERFQDALAIGSYDLVLVHPFFYAYAADTAGYRPLARLDQELVAVLLARPAAGIESIDQLEGRVLGLPDELSAVSAIMKVALFDHGLRPGLDLEVRHFRSKQSCLHAAAVGAVAACGVPRFLLGRLNVAKEFGLQVFYQAPPAMHFVLAVHPRLAEDDCIKIRERVLAWTANAEGRRMLRARGWQGFVPAEDAEYDQIREMQEHVQHLAKRS